MKSLNHECAVCGVIGHPDSAAITIAGLIALQHRGQEWFGVAAKGRHRIHLIRQPGLVASSSNQARFRQLRGNPVIGHNRYSTTGASTQANAQPHLSKNGQLALCANGDVVPSAYAWWRELLEQKGHGPTTTNDGELLLRIVEWRLEEGDDIVAAIQTLQKSVIGAFSGLAIYDDQLIAWRDLYGNRPLVVGRGQDSNLRMVASESCAMVAMGATSWEEILPGEVRVINQDGTDDQYHLPPLPHRAHCVFELIYFSFPTSKIFDIPVSLFRERLGARLAAMIPADADLVMSVPDSSNNAAVGLANETKRPFRLGLVRPHYQGRSFIAPEQAQRDKIVGQKLIADPAILNGQSAVVVDDSIVRGTTSQRTITKLRQAGAKQIHLRIISPPITHSCYYGVDTPDESQLIGNTKSVEEIRQFIGADSLVYLKVDDLKAVIRSFGKDPDDYCFACFTGDYPTPL